MTWSAHGCHVQSRSRASSALLLGTQALVLPFSFPSLHSFRVHISCVHAIAHRLSPPSFHSIPLLHRFRPPAHPSVLASPSLSCLSTMANAASGMAVDNECKLKFLELKRKKTYRYIIFKIDDASQKIVVEKMGGPDESYETFMGCLPEKDCRYAVYDLDFVTEDNCQKTKIFFIAWSPDTSRVRTKMLYASSKDRFKRELDVTYEVQATDPTEIGLDVLKERAF